VVFPRDELKINLRDQPNI